MEAENYFEVMEYLKEIAISTVSNLPLSLQMLAGSSMAIGAYKLVNSGMKVKNPTVSIIKLEGVIMAGGGGSPNPMARSQNINLDGIKGIVDKAFAQPNLELVCLVINSPGGSPAQSDLVYRYIKRAAEMKKVPVIAFVEDVAASGGYWLACTASKIFATRSSVVGSIGVITSGFGFHEIIKKYGIERRVITAGKNKSVMDPFLPVKAADLTIITGLLDSTYKVFVAHVKKSRGKRLAGSKDIFSGEFWTGDKALELGLIDGIDTVFEYIDREFGPDVKVFDASAQPSFLMGAMQRLMPAIPFFKEHEASALDIVSNLCREERSLVQAEEQCLLSSMSFQDQEDSIPHLR
jgi:signal peptide peptidase SppA